MREREREKESMYDTLCEERETESIYDTLHGDNVFQYGDDGTIYHSM